MGGHRGRPYGMNGMCFPARKDSYVPGKTAVPHDLTGAIDGCRFAQPQLPAHPLLASGFQPGSGQGFKERRKPAGGFRPRQLHPLHAVRC